MPQERLHTRDAVTVQGEGSVARGQSRMIAILLLMVVTIGLTVALAAFSFALTPSENDDVQMAKVDIKVASGQVIVIHDGGDNFQAEDLRVEINGGIESMSLNNFSDKAGDDGRFAAGERWKHDVTFTDSQVRVTVVHEPSETILADDRFDV